MPLGLRRDHLAEGRGRGVLQGVRLGPAVERRQRRTTGDAGRHSALRTGDATDRTVPFHKLTQWLTYSLLEPLETAGLTVVDLDELTALPEYRNGGLLVDLGVIRPRAPVDPEAPYDVASELIVEWRALTVALLDRVADGLRQRLGRDATSMPLAKILEGGTWAAGRRLARERRADASPPVKVVSDGTVF